jgi:tetratricopeptide (TPR) repeat protein
MTSLTLRLNAFMVGVISLNVIILAQAQQDLPRTTAPTRSSFTGSISGRVVLPSGEHINSSVRISLSSPEDPGPIVYTDNNGNFSFNGLNEGTYTIEVLADRKLYEPASETVRLIRSSRLNIQIYLKEKAKAPSSGEIVVSANEIDQNVPSPAKKEYDRALSLVNEGRIEEAIVHLKRALDIYPSYLVARNDLGVQYLKLDRVAEAAEQFEAAISAHPKAYNPHLNMGIALLKSKRYSDAIDPLDKACAIDSSRPASHLYLGIALLETDDLSRAQKELSSTVSLGGREFAVAHFYLARVSMKKGDREEAISELKAFLETSPTGVEAVRARQLWNSLGQ